MNMIDSMTTFRARRIPKKQEPIYVAQPVVKHITDCPICMDPIDNRKNVIITKCNHQFCSECLLKEMNNRNTCPICRTVLKEEKEKIKLSDDDLREIVMRNLSYMPDDHLNIVKNILPLLKASKIPDLFEENVNLINELQRIEENLTTTINLFGYYLASDLRDIIETDES